MFSRNTWISLSSLFLVQLYIYQGILVSPTGWNSIYPKTSQWNHIWYILFLLGENTIIKIWSLSQDLFQAFKKSIKKIKEVLQKIYLKLNLKIPIFFFPSAHIFCAHVSLVKLQPPDEIILIYMQASTCSFKFRVFIFFCPDICPPLDLSKLNALICETPRHGKLPFVSRMSTKWEFEMQI